MCLFYSPTASKMTKPLEEERNKPVLQTLMSEAERSFQFNTEARFIVISSSRLRKLL